MKIKALMNLTLANGIPVTKDAVLDVSDAEGASLVATHKAVAVPVAPAAHPPVPAAPKPPVGQKPVVPVSNPKTGAPVTPKKKA